MLWVIWFIILSADVEYLHGIRFTSYYWNYPALYILWWIFIIILYADYGNADGYRKTDKDQTEKELLRKARIDLS